MIANALLPDAVGPNTTIKLCNTFSRLYKGDFLGNNAPCTALHQAVNTLNECHGHNYAKQHAKGSKPAKGKTRRQSKADDSTYEHSCGKDKPAHTSHCPN